MMAYGQGSSCEGRAGDAAAPPSEGKQAATDQDPADHGSADTLESVRNQ